MRPFLRQHKNLNVQKIVIRLAFRSFLFNQKKMMSAEVAIQPVRFPNEKTILSYAKNHPLVLTGLSVKLYVPTVFAEVAKWFSEKAIPLDRLREEATFALELAIARAGKEDQKHLMGLRISLRSCLNKYANSNKGLNNFTDLLKQSTPPLYLFTLDCVECLLRDCLAKRTFVPPYARDERKGEDAPKKTVKTVQFPGEDAFMTYAKSHPSMSTGIHDNLFVSNFFPMMAKHLANQSIAEDQIADHVKKLLGKAIRDSGDTDKISILEVFERIQDFLTLYDPDGSKTDQCVRIFRKGVPAQFSKYEATALCAENLVRDLLAKATYTPSTDGSGKWTRCVAP